MFYNIMRVLDEQDGIDSELLVFAMTLINKTLYGIPDQEKFKNYRFNKLRINIIESIAFIELIKRIHFMTSQMPLICKIWKKLKLGTAKRKVLKIKAQRISHILSFHKIYQSQIIMITHYLTLCSALQNSIIIM